MISVLIRHKVKDFDAWKPYFDDDADRRRAAGSQGYRLFRSAEDPNDLMLVFDWDTTENARAFIEDPTLKEVMDEAGVISEPTFEFLDEIEASMPEKPIA